MTHIITIKLDSEQLCKSIMEAIGEHIKYSGFSDISVGVKEVVEPVVPDAPPMPNLKDVMLPSDKAPSGLKSFMTDDEIPF